MGEEAVELVANGTFDAIVCDHRMEGLSGIDVWQAVVAARPDMADRWIMMSGDILNPSLDAFAAVNNVTVLAKPFDLETLDRALRYRLEAAGPSRG
jgi:CheY-like chemotaxis protein